MAMVRMKLTFWHKDKKPGDVIEVRPEEVPMWFGFAERLPDSEQPEPEPSRDPDRRETKTTTAGAGTRAATGSPKTPPVTTEKTGE